MYYDSHARAIVVPSNVFGPLKIHYRECGAGAPLLLVHGLMTSSYSFRYVLAGLSARFHVIVPDLPGAGRSQAPSHEPLGAGALAEWIGDFQAALDIRGCAAVGNSLGGYLCMRRALAEPSSFSRLVNIHSPAFPIARLRALRFGLSIPGMQRALRWWVRRNPERWAHRNVHYYDETLKSLEEAREYGAPLSTEEGARAFVGYLHDTMAPSGFAEFARSLTALADAKQPFPVPLLLLYSRQDPLVPPANGERLMRLIAGAKTAWLDGSSHFAHVDSPERVVPLLLDFLLEEVPRRD
jgi:pimeloyl-ACP methyl ester carboxylesterase